MVRQELGLGPFEIEIDVDVSAFQPRRKSIKPPERIFVGEGSPDDDQPIVMSALEPEDHRLPFLTGHPGDSFDMEYISSYQDLPSWPPTPENTVTELSKDHESATGALATTSDDEAGST